MWSVLMKIIKFCKLVMQSIFLLFTNPACWWNWFGYTLLSLHELLIRKNYFFLNKTVKIIRFVYHRWKWLFSAFKQFLKMIEAIILMKLNEFCELVSSYRWSQTVTHKKLSFALPSFLKFPPASTEPSITYTSWSRTEYAALPTRSCLCFIQLSLPLLCYHYLCCVIITSNGWQKL